MRQFLFRRMLAIVLFLASAGTALADGSNVPNPHDRLGRCEPQMVQAPFAARPGLRVLITRFNGEKGTSENFGADLGPAIRDHLPAYASDVIGNDAARLGLRPQDVQAVYVPCWVDTHSEARRIGSAWTAHVVIWGEAIANEASANKVISIKLPRGAKLVIGSHNYVRAAPGAQVNLGINLKTAPPPPRSFKTSLTAVDWPELETSRPSASKTHGGVMELNLPSLVPEEALGLFELMLGWMALERERYQLALALFKRGAELHYRGARIGSEFWIPIGRAYLGAGQPKDGLSAFQQALDTCEMANNYCAARAYEFIAGAHTQLGDVSAARAAYEQALNRVRTLKDPVHESYILSAQANLQPGSIGAIKLLKQSLEKAQQAKDISRQATVFLELANHYTGLGENEASLSHSQQALELHKKTGEVIWQALDLVSMALTLEFSGKPDLALRRNEEALELYRNLGDQVGQRIALGQVGDLWLQQFDKPRGFAYLEQARQLSKKMGRVSEELVALNAIGSGHLRFGEKLEAKAAYDEMLKRARSSNDLEQEASALGGQSKVQAALGNLQEAVDRQREALAIYRQIKKPMMLMQALVTIALRYSARGDFDNRRAALTEALSLARQQHNVLVEASTLFHMAGDYLLEGNFAPAIPLAQKSIELARQNPGDSTEGSGLYVIGVAHYQLGRHAQAQAVLQQALDVAKRSGEPTSQSLILTFLGQVAAARGEHAQALLFYDQAMTLARPMNDDTMLAPTPMEMADSLVQLRRSSEAVTRYAESAGTYLRQQPRDRARALRSAWRGLRLALRDRLWPQADALLSALGLPSLSAADWLRLRTGLIEPARDAQALAFSTRLLNTWAEHFDGDDRTLLQALARADRRRPTAAWECSGAVVSDLSPHFPAERAGLKLGEIIFRYDGRCMKDNQELRPAQEATTGKSQVILEVLRNGRSERLTLPGGVIGFTVEAI